ncbi:MAG: class I SAM-dependent RNA methyltransferase [Polyangiaceae bacterium]|nr:class I SAM-dependent RNA methyltransferase [Polyangiaceae bacterium]
MTRAPSPSTGVQVAITRIDADGAGIGRVGDDEYVVPGAFPGERVVATPLVRSRHHARVHARLEQVVAPAPGRVRAPCERHPSRGGRCTGCPLLELDLESQRRAKLDALRALGLDADRIEGSAFAAGYRRSAKRVVFRRGGALALGSFERRSHRPADMRGCAIDHPLLSRAADAVADEATRLGVEPWDERSARGELEAVWLRTDGARVLVTLVTRQPDARFAALARALLGRGGIVGVAASRRDATDNSLRGEPARALAGDATLECELAGIRQRLGPLGFLQPHPEIAERAYRDLLLTERGEPLSGNEAWDLYAGAGVTTRLLSARFARVLPCESYPESAAALGVEAQSVEQFLGERLAEGRRAPTLIVANPPRAGLGEAVCDRLARTGARRITVMSCGPAALARDLERLERGGYARCGVRAYDTLPGTAHVEVVVWLASGASPAP